MEVGATAGVMAVAMGAAARAVVMEVGATAVPLVGATAGVMAVLVEVGATAALLVAAGRRAGKGTA